MHPLLFDERVALEHLGNHALWEYNSFLFPLEKQGLQSLLAYNQDYLSPSQKQKPHC